MATRSGLQLLKQRCGSIARTLQQASAGRLLPTQLLHARSLHSACAPRAAPTATSVSASTSDTPPAAHTRHLVRDPSFAQLTEEDVRHFRGIVGEEGIVQDEAELHRYNNDWMNKFHGASKLVLRPKSSAEVSAILSHCSARRLAVVPQGGNTGLVGGSVPVFDEVVLSMGRMNRVLKLDEYSGIVTCEAGVILENLNSYLEERGFVMPLDLGAKGSCQIGGNVSTNAGGLRYVRYGSLHGNVLGLEVVLADGRVVDNLSTLRKDNTGYDLKQLFIGAEGTLGVVTKVSILAARKPKFQMVALLGCASYAHVLQAMQQARADLLEIVSAIEFLDRDALALVLKHIPGARDPLEKTHPFYMLIETSGANEQHDQEKLQRFLESAMEKSLILDGTVAQDTAQSRALWSLRESVAEALSKAGAVYKYDVSLPVAGMYDLVNKIRDRLHAGTDAGEVGGVVGYGHLGDGNLHLNVHSPKFSKKVLGLIEPYIFEQTSLERGSVSAEHGMGLSKAQYIGMSKSPEMVALMRQIKSVFDPKNILNPYKVLPPPEEQDQPPRQ